MDSANLQVPNPSVSPERAGDFCEQAEAEALLCRVTARRTGYRAAQAEIENDHRRLKDWDREYVAFSGFFGTHGPNVFAAAPELLSALIAAESLFEHTFANGGTVHKQMRAAIAKARGEA